MSLEYLRRAFTPISVCMISAHTFQSWIRSDGFTALGDCGTMVFQKKRSSCLDHVLPPIVCELGVWYRAKERKFGEDGLSMWSEEPGINQDAQKLSIGKDVAGLSVEQPVHGR